MEMISEPITSPVVTPIGPESAYHLDGFIFNDSSLVQINAVRALLENPYPHPNGDGKDVRRIIRRNLVKIFERMVRNPHLPNHGTPDEPGPAGMGFTDLVTEMGLPEGTRPATVIHIVHVYMLGREAFLAAPGPVIEGQNRRSIYDLMRDPKLARYERVLHSLLPFPPIESGNAIESSESIDDKGRVLRRSTRARKQRGRQS